MDNKVRILLVGIGGYAGTYVNPLLDCMQGKDGTRDDVNIVGCVDPFPDSCGRLHEIRKLAIPVFDTMDAFFGSGCVADLAIISTPIHFHAGQIIKALEHGCHVLCEKPLCGDPDAIPAIIEARNKAHRTVSIGYQWSHADAILKLKQDILDGIYGDPIFLKTIVLWPRGFSYYDRGSGWAGKLRAADGSLILDSVANNATAHYLHNIFYILGREIDASAEPIAVKAELKRANDIENYDTCRMELTFENNVQALYLVSHATEKQQDPLFDYRFTKGRIVFEESGEEKLIRGLLDDGTVRVYGDPFQTVTDKLWRAVDGVKDPTVKPTCGPEAAAVHTRCIAEVQKSGVTDFPKESIVLREDESGVYVKGLFEKMMSDYNEANGR